MRKIMYLVIGLSVLLNCACRLDKLDLNCMEHATFERKYTDAPSFTPYDIEETTDGRYIICGSVDYDSDTDIFLMKVDKEGEVLFFESERKASTDEVCNSITLTEDRGFLICGKVENKVYFAKYSFQGKRLDDTRVELFDNSECECLTKSDGINYVFSGRAGNPQVSNSYVGTLSLQGQKPSVITHYLPNPRDGGEAALSVIPSKGGFVAVGHSFNSSQADISTAMHFYRLDDNLQRIPNTERFYHLGTQADIAHGVLETTDGNYIVAGKLYVEGAGSDAFMLKLNPQGEILQSYEYGGNLNDHVGDIIYAHEAGQYILAGYSRSHSTDGSEDMYLMKIKEDGTVVWERTFGEAGINERAHAVVRTECEGYILTGFGEKNDGTREARIVKVDANGNAQ